MATVMAPARPYHRGSWRSLRRPVKSRWRWCPTSAPIDASSHQARGARCPSPRCRWRRPLSPVPRRRAGPRCSRSHPTQRGARNPHARRWRRWRSGPSASARAQADRCTSWRQRLPRACSRRRRRSGSPSRSPDAQARRRSRGSTACSGRWAFARRHGRCTSWVRARSLQTSSRGCSRCDRSSP
jgi:hypothetical protein